MLKSQNGNPRLLLPVIILLVVCFCASCKLTPTEYDGPVASYNAYIDSSQKQFVLDSIESLILDDYVIPENLKNLPDKLDFSHFGQENDPFLFARSVTNQLRAASNDKHLLLFYDSSMVKRVIFERQIGEDWNNAANYSAYLKNKQVGKERNFEFEKLEILPGNVGYLKFNRFAAFEDAKDVIDASFQFLSNSDAVIVDLRHNYGGHVNSLDWVLSYFLENDDFMFYRKRRERNPIRYIAFNEKKHEKLTRVPVFVLISPSTASAAEILAHAVQEKNRGLVVGETSWGGAHACSMMVINDAFALLLPRSAIHGAVTNQNWEAIGVKPDIELKDVNAVNETYALALDSLIKTEKDSSKKAFQIHARDLLEYKLQRFNQDYKPQNWTEFTGTYKDLEIFQADGRLYVYNQARVPVEMIPLEKDRFYSVRSSKDILEFLRDKAGRINAVKYKTFKGKFRVYKKN